MDTGEAPNVSVGPKGPGEEEGCARVTVPGSGGHAGRDDTARNETEAAVGPVAWLEHPATSMTTTTPVPTMAPR